jgi:hypothetical protein
MRGQIHAARRHEGGQRLPGSFSHMAMRSADMTWTLGGGFRPFFCSVLIKKNGLAQWDGFGHHASHPCRVISTQTE